MSTVLPSVVGIPCAVISIGSLVYYFWAPRNGAYREARAAIEEIGPSERRALIHLIRHGDEFTLGLAALPDRMSQPEAFEAYMRCAAVGLVVRRDINSTDIMNALPQVTFHTNPNMKSAIHKLLARR